MLLILAGLALTACGDDSADPTVAGPSPSPSSSPPSQQPPQTSLVITIDAGDGAAAQDWTLTCDPPGGTHPDPAAACAALADIDPDVFQPIAPNQVCTQIYGGPETATMRGSRNGTPLNASFARNNGCEIARWDTITPLLPTGGATG